MVIVGIHGIHWNYTESIAVTGIHTNPYRAPIGGVSVHELLSRSIYTRASIHELLYRSIYTRVTVCYLYANLSYSKLMLGSNLLRATSRLTLC